MSNENDLDLADAIGASLPYLRRYARALTGRQASGDAYAAATLEAILSDRSIFDTAMSPKVALFKVFHAIWHSSGAPSEAPQEGVLAKAHERLAALTPNSREALLLKSIEQFSEHETAQIMGTSKEETTALIRTAYAEMEEATRGRIMIIEDEAIIALDLDNLVSDLGHEVVGIARTKDDAVEMGVKERPDLILADIHLADNSSGIDAVNDLGKSVGKTSVIYITAFPERLLTGTRDEPAFLIAKPFTDKQVQTAVSQAMFFSSTEPLTA